MSIFSDFFQAEEDNEDLNPPSSVSDTSDTLDEFGDFLTSQETNKNRFDIYRRKDCKINRLSLMVRGDSRAGKTRLIDRLTNSTHSESANNQSLRIVDCAVSMDEMGITWHIPKDPFHQRVYQEFLTEGHDDVCGISDLEMKIWDVSGVGGAYNSHKVFLAPSSICLLVLNVANGLHGVPEIFADQSTMPRSPLDSLDHLLRIIDLCASHDENEDHSECAIIVLTHRDLIDEAQRDTIIHEYKNQIIDHVQSTHACKYVHPTVFDLGHHEESDKELHSLQRAIFEKFESNQCKGANGNPLSWLKFEADILKFFAEKDRRCLSLKQQTVRKSYGMSMESLTSFLHFHFHYRNFIVDESAIDALNTEHSTNASCMITDPLLIDETFMAVISLWEQRDLSQLSLYLRQGINLDVKQHLVALSTLEYL